MLAELQERDATDPIAVGPAFVSGRAQVAAWRAAEGLIVPRLAPLSRHALRVWGVDAAGEAAIRAACASFVRVSPVNLVLSGLLRRLLAGERPPGAAGVSSGWTPPPPPLGPLPGLVDLVALPPAERAVLATLGTTVGGQPFVPGLYRMLASWPAFLAHVATVLKPHLEDRLTVNRPADKDEAIFLHPGEPVFERLRALVLERFANAARRGAVFVDPTATDPYMFHLAEATVVRRADPARSQPELDEIVECRLIGVRHGRLDAGTPGGLGPCPVEHLLLLRGALKLPPAFASFAVTAPEATVRVVDHLGEMIAGPLAAEGRQRAHDALAEREDFIGRGFDSHDAELASSRVRLTERARAGNAGARAPLERVKEQQRRLAERRKAALAELHREPDRIAPGPVRLIAHALVVPSADPEDRRRHDANVEAIAVRVVTAWEEAQGAVVKDVSTPARARAAGLGDHPGFDLLATYPDGSRRAIEVKGRAQVGDVEMTGNEWSKACNLLGGYWLYAVFDCATPQPQLCRVRNPFQSLLATAKGGVIIDERRIFAVAEGGAHHA